MTIFKWPLIKGNEYVITHTRTGLSAHTEADCSMWRCLKLKMPNQNCFYFLVKCSYLITRKCICGSSEYKYCPNVCAQVFSTIFLVIFKFRVYVNASYWFANVFYINTICFRQTYVRFFMNEFNKSWWCNIAFSMCVFIGGKIFISIFLKYFQCKKFCFLIRVAF